MDEVTARRQKKCAESEEGHTFTEDGYGICTKCLLRVTKAKKEIVEKGYE